MSDNRIIKRTMTQNMDTIEIAGPFDANDPDVISLADRILDEGKKNLMLDFSGVTYLTSPGISCIVKIIKKCQTAQAVVHLRNATADMVELLQLANLSKFITMV